MANPLEMLEATCTRLVRRIISLPRAIMGEGLDLMRNHHQFPPPNVPVYHQNHHPPLDHSSSDHLQPDLGFISGFEQQFGITHPFFYACRFLEVLKMAQDEHKFVFMYLHMPNHPFTPHFCQETLCSEVVVQFLDSNFVSWGGVADQGEGLHMATMLRPTTYPFCAIVAPGSGHNLDVVQQIEGPVTPEELVETLQTMLDEQGSMFGNGRTHAEQKRLADLQLIQEQDAVYAASLQADQENESKLKKVTQLEENASANAQHSQILIRFPNGERKEKAFSSVDKIEAIFEFIDSLGLSGVGKNYRLVSSFPRKVYGINQRGMSLKDARLYPKATLFIELV